MVQLLKFMSKIFL